MISSNNLQDAQNQQDTNYSSDLIKFLGKKRIDSEKFDLIKSIIGENLSEQEIICNEIDSLNEKRNKLIDDSLIKFDYLIPYDLKCNICMGVFTNPVKMSSGKCVCNKCFDKYEKSIPRLPNSIFRCPVTNVAIDRWALASGAKEVAGKVKIFLKENPIFTKKNKKN